MTVALTGAGLYSACCEPSGSAGDDERPGISWREKASPYVVEYGEDGKWWGICERIPE
jgi:hypothetical protein